MTIRKGEQWGTVCSTPVGLIEFVDERALGKYFRDGGIVSEAILKSGTLIQALGASSSSHDRESIKVEIDLIKVQYTDKDDHEHKDFAVGSLVIGKRTWLGEISIVSNSGYLGRREVLPKAHPNDGVFDLLVIQRGMQLFQRWLALRRIQTSSHLPHPDMSTKQLADFSWPTQGSNAASTRCRLVIDGENLGLVTAVKMQAITDAICLYI